MGSLSGILQRPVVAASAVAIASVCADLHDRLWPSSSTETCSSLEQSNSSLLQEKNSSWVSKISSSRLADLSFITNTRVPIPNIKNAAIPNTRLNSVRNHFCSLESSAGLINSYQLAELENSAKPAAYTCNVPYLPPEVLYRWHLPQPSAIYVSGSSEFSSVKPRTVVVLLGWLGAKQKHLKRYAEWYTARGFHAITFTFPMSEILTYQVGGKAEQDIELLVNHLADWLEEDHGKNLVFHTFSNTGWLTYGVILEKLQKLDATVLGSIKGCIVDSAPAATPDPQVWASGFSAAFLKKHSVATKGSTGIEKSEAEMMVGGKSVVEAKPAAAEAALLAVLEKFFEVILNLPSVNRRLSDVLELLASRQPRCPQLYLYSSADKVIPAGSVECFMEKQRGAGREVRACDFVYTPHVDHFRNDPELYSSQLTQFVDDFLLTRCRRQV